MNIKPNVIKNSSGLSIQYFDNGIFSGIVLCDTLSINLSMGTKQEFACSEAYLRIYRAQKIEEIYSLRSQYSQKLKVYEHALEWSGECPAGPFCYSVELAPQSLCWCNKVELELNAAYKQPEISWDLVFVEDRGLGVPGFLRGAELYAGQYLDIKAIEGQSSQALALCFRQNLSGDEAPWLIEGLIEGASGFACNGHRFYGKGWEQDGCPSGLWSELGKEVEQEQFTISAIASQRYSGNHSVSRISVLREAHGPSKDSDYALWQEGVLSFAQHDSGQMMLQREFSCAFPYLLNQKKIYHSPQLSQSQLNELFPEEQRILCEELDAELSAFFTPDYQHIVLQNKDLSCAQSHCHIIRGGHSILPDKNLPSLASFMNGCFIAHYSVGNTVINSIFSSPKFYIDLYKQSGLRISVFHERQWLQLGLPAIYQMSFFSSTWYYIVGSDLLQIQVAFDRANRAYLRLHSRQGKEYPIQISIQLEDGASNGTKIPLIKPADTGRIFISPHPQSEANFHPVELRLEDLQFAEQQYEGMIQLKGCTHHCALQLLSYTEIKDQFKQLFSPPSVIQIQELSDHKLQQRLNASSYWFSHNALIHFSVLYGAEQMKGAAWGIRDVLQGSLEYCFATEQHDAARQILRRVLSQQRLDNGEWPQWFMLEGFEHIRDSHTHGDIVIWVLKALCEYIGRYGADLLQEELPFFDTEQAKATESRPVAEHIEKLLQAIARSLCPQAYHFPAYGDGDWNDSLQPASAEMKENLVSIWSSILLAQYLCEFSFLCQKYQLPYFDVVLKLAAPICQGFEQLLEDYDYPPGFLLIDPHTKKMQPLMHSSEEHYPINYRLLPLKRAIKSKLIPKTRALQFQKLVKEHLQHKDGVRLLDYAIEYRGGQIRFFRRLEQAAYFGREIGLMYSHAHLRYIEALLDLGMGTSALKELDKVLPMQIHQRISGALPRQANSYFASSDLVMNTRYQFSGRLNRSVSEPMLAAGGWRIYSSGPGIMLSLLHNQLLGVKRIEAGQKLLLNPLLSQISARVTAQIAHPSSLENGRPENNRMLELVVDVAGGQNGSQDADSDKEQNQEKTFRIQEVFVDGQAVAAETVQDAYGYAGVEIACPAPDSSTLRIVLA